MLSRVPTRLSGEERRADFLRVAAEIIIDKGVDAVTMEATASGLTTAAFGCGLATGSSGSMARAPTPPATISRNASGAAISEERRRPSGPLPVSQRAAPGGVGSALAST